MSEIAEQSQEIRELSLAMVEARAALAAAERQTQEYSKAVVEGTQKVDASRIAELEAAKAIAAARASATSSALRAAAAARVEVDANTARLKAFDQAHAASEKAARDAAELARAQGELRGRSVTAGGALRGLGGAVGVFATAAATGAAAAAGLYHALSDGAVEATRHNRALTVLGSAYRQVEEQTRGAVSAQEALRARGVVVQTGMQMTAEQLGVVTRASREYALATGVEASQALEQLSEGLAEASNDQLQKYNIRLVTTLPRQEQFNDAIAQLSARFQGVAPAAEQADERVARLNRTSGETRAQISLLVNTALEGLLAGLFKLGGGTDNVTDRLRSFNQELRTLGEGSDANAASNRTLAAIQRVRQEYELQRRAFQQSSMLAGSDIVLPQVAALTVAQREQMVTLFNESSRLSTAVFQQRVREVLSLQQREAQAAAERRQLSEVEAQVERVNAADRRAHAGDDLGMARQAAQQAGLRINLTQAAVTPMQRLAFLQREIGRLSQNEAQNRAQIVSALQESTQIASQQRQAAEAAHREAVQAQGLKYRELDLDAQLRALQASSAALGAEQAQVERRRFETAAEHVQRQIEAQRHILEVARATRTTEEQEFERWMGEQRERARVLREAADSARAAEAAKDAQYQSYLRQDQMAERMRGAFGLAGDQVATFNQRLAEGAKVGVGSMLELGGAIAQASMQAAQSGEDVGSAVAKQVDQWAGAKAIQWGMQSLEALAGAGIAYLIRPDAVPGLLASAAVYGGLALGAGVTSAAIPNAPAASSSSGGGGVGRDRGFGMAASSRSDSAMEARAPAQIVFNVSGVMANEQTQEVLVRALGEAEARGLMQWGR